MPPFKMACLKSPKEAEPELSANRAAASSEGVMAGWGCWTTPPPPTSRPADADVEAEMRDGVEVVGFTGDDDSVAGTVADEAVSTERNSRLSASRPDLWA